MTDQVDYIGKLIQHCQKNGLPAPKFDEENTDGPAHNKKTQMSCAVGDLKEIADFSPKKRESKAQAARMVLERLDVKIQGEKAPSKEDADLVSLVSEFTNLRVESLSANAVNEMSGLIKTVQGNLGEDLRTLDLTSETDFYGKLEDLARRHQFTVGKKEFENADLGTDMKYGCTITISSFPANIAFDVAGDKEEAKKKAAKSALIFLKHILFTAKKSSA